MKTSSIIDTLSDLINIKSYVSDNNDESKLGEFICNFLKEKTDLIIEKQIVEKDRYNIIAYKNKTPSVILFGHMDTVSPKIESRDSFKAREEGGKLYGLGSVDMKAGLAIMLETAVKFRTSDRIAYIFTVDEEYEFKGVRKLVKEYTFEPKYIVNLEPTDLEIFNGCRGVTEFSLTIHGKSCHAGKKEEGVNAIEKTYDFYKILQQEISKTDTEDLKSTLNLAYVNGGIINEQGIVESNANVVPNFCKSVGEIRIASNKINERFLKNCIFSIAKDLNVTVSDYKLKFLLSSMYTEKSELKNFETVLTDMGLDARYGNITKTGYFEVQQLQGHWGGDVIIFGPGPSSNAHKIDEYVDIESVIKAFEVIENFVKKQ